MNRTERKLEFTRRYMAITGLAGVAVASSMTSGCHRKVSTSSTEYGQVAPVPSLSWREEEEWKIREMKFRDLLDSRGSKDEVAFLSFSGGVDGRAYSDPPDEFMKRLADAKMTLKKASAAISPTFGERDASGRYIGYRDKETGARGSVYWVNIEWVSDNEVKLDIGRLGGPLDGGGHVETLKRENRTWVHEYTGPFKSWVS